MVELALDGTGAPGRTSPTSIRVSSRCFDPIASGENTGAVHLLYDWPLIGLLNATTDYALNEVDRLYIDRGGLWVAPRHPAGPSAVAQLLKDLRERVDLPVEDLAAMCGLRRRQFYNLLSGVSDRSTRESQIRLVYELVNQLDQALDGDRARLRAAVLMPIGEHFETLFSVAANGEIDQMRSIGEELLRRIETGEVSGMVPRPAPHLQRLVRPGAEERVDEFVRGHAPVRDEADGAPDGG